METISRLWFQFDDIRCHQGHFEPTNLDSQTDFHLNIPGLTYPFVNSQAHLKFMLILSLPDDEIDIGDANAFMDTTPPQVIAGFEADPDKGFIWREFGIQGAC